MKLQRAFFAVIALAFIVSLGSLLTGGSNQKAQVITSGVNSVEVSSPAVGTNLTAGQTFPMTCDIGTAPGFTVWQMTYSWFQNTSSGTVSANFSSEQGLSYGPGSYTKTVTLPSNIAPGQFALHCTAYYYGNGAYSGYQQDSNYVNLVTTPVSVPGCTNPSATNYNPNATVDDGSCTYPAADTTAPSIPTGVGVSSATSSSLRVAWTASTDNVGVTKYEVYRNNGGSTSMNTTTPIATVNAPATSYVNPGLLSSRTYRYQVKAVDGAGNKSGLSTKVGGTTLAVAAPTSVTVTSPTTNSLTLNWAASSSANVFDYVIYANAGGSTSVNTTTPVGTVLAGTHTFTHQNLNPGTTYKYRLRARDDASNASSLTSQVSGTTSTATVAAPSVPTGLATTSTQNSITTSWTASTGAAGQTIGYKIFRSTSATGSFSQLNSTLQTATTYTNSSLSSNVTYYYKVQACYTAITTNCSAQSVAVSGTTAAPADATAPTATITAPTANQVLVAGTTSVTLSVTTNEAATCKWNTTDVAYSSMANTLAGAGSTSHSGSVTGLADGTSYTRYVRCQDTAGNMMTTSASRAFSVAAPVDTTAPAVPTLSVGAVTSTTVALSWNAVTDASSPVTYKIYRNGTYIGSPISGTSTTDLDLVAGTLYSYTISACDSAPAQNCSAQSAAVTATTTAIPTIVSSLQIVQTNGTVVSTLTSGQQLNVGSQTNANYAPLSGAFSIKANPGTPAPTSIKFDLTGPSGFTAYTQCESTSPFALYGDASGTYTSWPTATQTLGAYTLTVTPYAAATCTGAAGTPVVSQFILANFDDLTPPTNPTSAASTYRSAGEIRLSWAASTDAGGVHHYNVTRNPGTTVNVGNQTSFIDTNGVTSTGTYSYTVTAVDNVGNTSGVSNAVSAPVLSTSFANGNQVETNTTTSIKVTPDAAGNAGTQGAGTVGVITNSSAGPTNPVWITGGVHYWYVDFTTGTDGWVSETNLDSYTPPPVDTTAPTASITAPTAGQVLASGTTSVNLTVTTNEAATCRWGTTDVAYGSMSNTFTGSGGTSHTYSLIGLTNGTSYTRYVRCQDTAGNAMSTSVSVSFSVAGVVVPPTDPVVNTTCPTGTTITANAGTTNSVVLCAAINESTPSITLNWSPVSGRTTSSVVISRKSGYTSTTWTQVASLGAVSSWTDTSVTPGTYYEYKVVVNGSPTGYIATGIKLPQETYRGKLVLVIDNTFQTSLATQIQGLIDDLNADKWVVVPIYVSRTATPASVRSQIQAIYNADTANTKAVYLLGHVPVASAGNMNPDGHADRGMSSDTYYGEMTSTWNNVTGGCSGYSWAPQTATSQLDVPSNDARFCHSSPPSSLELQVGRVDFYKILAYGQSEQTMLSNYLTKARNFKTRQTIPTERMYIRDRLGNSGLYSARGTWASVPAVVGIQNTSYDTAYDPALHTILNNQSYLFAYGSYYGKNTRGTDGGVTMDWTTGLGASISPVTLGYAGSTWAAATTNWGGVFNIVFGSYFGEWNDENGYLRGMLGSGNALTSVYGGTNYWFFHQMGMGKNIGYSGMMTQNNTGYYTPAGGMDSSATTGRSYMSLMGDPTLRATYLARPGNLIVSNLGGFAAFSWTSSSDSPLGYNIYEIQSNNVRKVNSTLISGTTFNSTDTYSSSAKYMVTAVKVKATNSGTYYNESLGTLGGGSGGGTPLSDTTAPIANITAPTAGQVLAVGTTTTTLTVATDEAATCKWSTTDQSYSSMANTFSSTGFVAHSTTLSGLVNGTSYTRYVRCQDTYGNAMTTSATVSFSVDAVVTPPPSGGGSGGSVSGINGGVGPNLTANATACTNPSGGTIYYVDGTNGNDSNAGTSTGAAWKTIDKVNSSMSSITAGKMVCFKRGNTYRGKLSISQSGTASTPIIFDAYGTGSAPVISGTIAVTGWTQYSGSIYRANVAPATTPKYLFVDGSYQTFAKQPNTGFYYTNTKTASSITDSDNSWLSSQAANSLAGAHVVMRTSPWSYMRNTVTANSGGTITVPVSYGTNWADKAWGYTLQNKLSFLDTAGEWFYDSAAGQVYFWAPGGVNPSTLNVELASVDRGIAIGTQKTDIIVRNLAVEGYNDVAVYTSQNKRVTLENLEVANAETGVRIFDYGGNASGDAMIVRNNHIHALNMFGINSSGGDGHLIEGNVVEDVSTNSDRLYNAINNWGHMGIYLTGTTSNHIVRRNIFRDIGYIGLTLSGSGTVTENLVDNAMTILTDGSGIAFDYTNNMTISKNIVRNIYSNMTGMPIIYIGYIPLAKGIYFGDQNIQNTVVDGNIIEDVESDGIWMDHGIEYTGNRVTNNTIYKFTRSGIGISDYSNYRDFSSCGTSSNSVCFLAQYNDVVTGNKIYGTDTDENPLYLTQVYSNGTGAVADFGTIDNNYYYNPFRSTKIQRSRVFAGVVDSYTLPQWQAAWNEDDNSTASNYTLTNTAQAADLYYNATSAAITQSVSGCSAAGAPLTGTQTIQPFMSLVVEHGNC